MNTLHLAGSFVSTNSNFVKWSVSSVGRTWSWEYQGHKFEPHICDFSHHLVTTFCNDDCIE